MCQILLSWGYLLCVSSSGSCFLLHTVFRTRLMAPFTMMADGSHVLVYAHELLPTRIRGADIVLLTDAVLGSI